MEYDLSWMGYDNLLIVCASIEYNNLSPSRIYIYIQSKRNVILLWLIWFEYEWDMISDRYVNEN